MRAVLGEQAEGLTDVEVLHRFLPGSSFSVEQSQQRTGDAALLSIFQEVDERRGTGDLVELYIATANSTRDHTQEIEREMVTTFSRISKLGVWGGFLLVTGGVVGSLLNPSIAGELMGGVGGVAGLAAAPRIIEALRGRSSPAPDPTAELRQGDE